MKFRAIILLSILLIIVLSGCAKPTESIPTSTLVATATATSIPIPSITPTVIPTHTPTATPEPYANFTLSSPLQDITLDELSSIVSSPFAPPAPGWDDGHVGVDFAYWSRGSHEKMEGLEVYALMGGKVIGITNDRKPYGNQIIIETPLNRIPPALLALLSPVQLATPYPPNPRLPACELIQEEQWELKPDSLYTLYGHLMLPVSHRIGDTVQAGDLIGQVGTTGASVNPHLHLEMRWGPGGTEFASMGFYDTSTTDDERTNYCIWRVSGKYIHLNPMDVIETWLNLQRTGS